jgi:hypothetical protein
VNGDRRIATAAQSASASSQRLVSCETDADRISYRKTKRAEKIAGFDQAADLIIPSEFNPQVVIEAS